MSLKAADAQADQLFGVARRLRNPGCSAEKALLPISGFNDFFQKLQQRLVSGGVKIRLNSPVKVIKSVSSASLYCRGETQSFDLIVWATNPTPLLQTLLDIRLQTPPMAMRLLLGELPGGWRSSCTFPYYWQILDMDLPFTRVYVYFLQGRARFSVESFDVSDEVALRTDLDRLFGDLGFPTSYIRCGSIRQSRYVNYSTSEYEKLRAAGQKLMCYGVVPGGGEQYGRDEKILEMSKALKDMLSHEAL